MSNTKIFTLTKFLLLIQNLVLDLVITIKSFFFKITRFLKKPVYSTEITT